MDPMQAAPTHEENRAAFRELHGSRLHGFALLLTLGDRPRAGLLASDAMAAADNILIELRHPERAAAWLRAKVTRTAGTGGRRQSATARPDALEDLGVTHAALAGLSGLTRLERAAIIATAIERLDRRDVATIVGRDGMRLEKFLQRARRRYLDGATAAAGASNQPPGPIRRRIAASAQRTIG